MTTVSSAPGVPFRAEPVLGRRLGAGGEAEVFAVSGGRHLAYKRYHRPSAERSRKLQVMVEQPPDVPDDVALAWPQVLVGSPGDVRGFVMAQVGGGTSVPLVSVYNPQNRARVAPGFTWQYLLRTALNVARTVEALHAAGYVVGDLNESNLLVDRRARVALVDCDSIQVRDPTTAEVHPCPVGRPEYLAPELHGVDLAVVERSEEADAFALAVLVFHLLMEGRHPFAGRWRASGDPPDVAERVRLGAWPYRRHDRRAAPPPLGLSLSVLPRGVRVLVRRSFGAGATRPERRPTAGEWADALEAAEAGVRTCRRSDRHVIPHGRRCPWCARVDAGLQDPFPSSDGTAVAPRRRAGWVRRVRADIVEVIGRALPYAARAVPVTTAAIVAGLAWPVVAPIVVSLFLLPSVAALSTRSDRHRRRLDPRRALDRARAALAGAVEAARAGLVAGACALGAATTAASATLLAVGGSPWSVVRAASAAVVVGQCLLAPRVVAAWAPVAQRWDHAAARAPRATSAVVWSVGAAVLLAARRW